MEEFKKQRRVVVTGLGVISSIGIGWQEFWKNLLAGKSGISKIESFDTSLYDRHYGGEIKNFDPSKFISKHKIKQMGRASQMAIAAAKLAINDSRFKIEKKIRDRGGVFVGTTTGEIAILEKFYENLEKIQKKENSATDFLFFPSNIISANIAKEFKICGENTLFATACAAGNYSIARAFDLIRNGEIDYALAGGSDGFSKIVFTGFSRLYAIAPEKCQPFDKNRKGMIPAEGAGILFLETLEGAQKRKANIYAEILGYGLYCSAHHMTNPSAEGIFKTIKRAIENSRIKIEDIDYISAHGTGTQENDKAECKAIFEVFGKRVKKVPASSIKSMIGHSMGSAAVMEAAACCLAIKKGKIPPTMNFVTKDPDCDIDCVANRFKKHKVNIALNNSLAFGGNNACLIFRNIK